MLISVYSLIGAVTAMRSREHVDAQIIEVFIACERMTLKQYFGSLVLKEDTAYDCSLYAIFYQAHYIPVYAKVNFMIATLTYSVPVW